MQHKKVLVTKKSGCSRHPELLTLPIALSICGEDPGLSSLALHKLSQKLMLAIGLEQASARVRSAFKPEQFTKEGEISNYNLQL